MISSVIFAVACNLVPLIVYFVMNEEWEFYIPVLNITYKPWRLYVVTCALPGLVSHLILWYLPESPKFVLSQGNHAEAYRILQKMHRMNNGNDSKLDEFEITEETESIENRQRVSEIRRGKFPLLSSIWNQTSPLFKPPYLKPTLLFCVIQFGTFFTSNGFYMLYAEVMNRMATNVNDTLSARILVCDVITFKSSDYNSTNSHEMSEVSSFDGKLFDSTEILNFNTAKKNRS